MKTYQVFLGTNKPTGGVVTTYEWSQFLKQIDEKGNPMPPEKQQALDIATS